MGYRSEVFLGVKKGLEKKLDEVLIKHDLLQEVTGSEMAFTKKEHNYRYKNFDSVTGEASDWIDDKWIIYRASWLKWYDEYKDVEAVTNVIDEISEDGDKGFMVALGEDNQVHSESGCWWDYIDHVSELKIAG
jgi:hypothetical protein